MPCSINCRRHVHVPLAVFVCRVEMVIFVGGWQFSVVICAPGKTEQFLHLCAEVLSHCLRPN